MSISFSGLATGLDTSSWVESLVKIKQEKVNSYESTKKTLELTQEAVASIKSFFTSFRSVLEKVTDTKFGAAATDVFAQKLAASTNANIVSAIATNEAEEAKYDVNVDKLATQTKASSGIKQLETITQIQTATLNTKLGDLGVKNGSIDVTVNNVKNNIVISADNSIADFITKLKNIGVESNFNEKTGVFSVDLSKGSLVDNGTGIVEAFHLESSGWESTKLVTYTTTTVTSTASGDTKLSEISSSINSGNVELEVNGATYTVAIDKDMTLSSFVNTLKSYGVDAKLDDDGTLTIKDATISDVGNTNLLEGLGLISDVSSKSQITSGLKSTTVITTGVQATGSTKLSELDGWENISGTPQILISVDNSTLAIDFTGDSTLDDVVSELNNAGLKAELKDGTLTVSQGSVSGNVAELLGLTDKNISKVSMTGEKLYATVVTTATGDTKLVDLGIDLVVSATNPQPIININPNGNSLIYSSLSSDTTINDYFAILAENGINASISDGVITVESNGNFDAGLVATELGINWAGHTIVVRNGMSSTTKISYTITKTADANTTLGELGLGDKQGYIKSSNGDILATITGSSTMTVGDVLDNLKNQGITASIDNGVISITSSNSYIFTGELAEALGIQTVSTSTGTTIATSTSSSVPLTYTTSTVATADSRISDFVDLSGDTSDFVYFCNRDGHRQYSISINSNTTFSSLVSAMTDFGIDASFSNGRIVINSNNSNGRYVTSGGVNGILEKLGITTTVLSSTTTRTGTSYTGTVVTYTTSVSVTQDNASSVYLKDCVDGFVDGETMTVYYEEMKQDTITVNSDMTVYDLRYKLEVLGLQNFLNSDGSITLLDWNSSTLSKRYVTGDFADRMGWTNGSSTIKATTTLVESSKATYGYRTVSSKLTSYGTIQQVATMTQTATLDSKISGCISNWDSIDKNVYLRTSAGNIVRTITVDKSSSFSQVFDYYVFQPRGGGSVRASMSNGVLTLTQVAGTDTYENAGSRTSDYYYFTGDIVTALGIGTTTDSQTLTKTVGVIYTGAALKKSDGGVAHADTKLTDLYCNDGSGSVLSVGTSLEVSWVRNEVYNYATFTVESTSTVESFVDWLNSTTGINSSIIPVNFQQIGSTVQYSVAIQFGGDEDAYFNRIGSYYTDYTCLAYKFFGLSSTYNHRTTTSVNRVKNTSSNSQIEKYTVQSAATTSSKLTELANPIAAGTKLEFSFMNGSTGNAYYNTFTVTSTSTVDDMLTFLKHSGIDYSFSDGKLTIESGDTCRITKASNEFLDAFKMYNNPSLYDTTVWTTASETTEVYDILGTNSSRDLFTFGDGSKITKSVYSSMTMGDVIDQLKAKGFAAQIYNGSLSIRATSNCSTYIKSMDSTFADAFGIKVGEGITYYTHVTNSTSNALNRTTTAQMTGDTKLTDLGCSIGSFNIMDTYTVNGGVTYETFTTSASTTVNDFINWLNNKGYSGSNISDGKITIGTKSDGYIGWVGTSGYDNFFKKLGLSTDPYDYHTDATSSIYGNTSSNKLEKSTTYTANYSTTLGQLGLVGNGEVVFQYADDNTSGHKGFFTVTVYATDTIADLNGELYHSAIYGGDFSISANPAFITSMSDNLKDVLKLNVGEGYTYYVSGSTTYSNVTDGTTLIATETGYINENTIIKNINGYSYGSGVISIKDYNDSSYNKTITINQDGTLGDFLAQLRENGLNANVSDGTVSISASSGLRVDSVDGGSNIISCLVQAGGAITTVICDATSDGRTIKLTQTITATGSTKLNMIYDGVDVLDYPVGNRHLTFDITATDKNGKTLKYQVDAGTKSDPITLDELFAKFKTCGFDATIDDGKITLSSTVFSDFTIESGTGSAAVQLFGRDKVYEIASNLNTETITTAVTNATRDTLLKDLGVTAGEFYVYNNGVKYTALVSDDETIGSFMDNLKSFGIQTGLMNTDDGTKLMIIGNGDSYIAKSNSTTNASNVVEKLFNNNIDTTYNYIGSEKVSTTSTAMNDATKDTLLSEFDNVIEVPIMGPAHEMISMWVTYKAEGTLPFNVRGEDKTISITSTETFGSLVDKLNEAGIASSFHDGKLYISDAYDIELNFTDLYGYTSDLFYNVGITLVDMSGFMASGEEVQETTTSIVEKNLSAANYADFNTTLGSLNISDGTFSIFRNGKKAVITIDSTKTLGDLNSQIASKFSDVELKLEDGKMVIYSKTDGVTVEAGTTTDSSNIQAVLGLTKDESGLFSKSTRELYRVNTDTLVTASGMFRLGTVKEGTFTVGNQEINIDNTTKLSDIINQINNSEDANATAYWDSINGKLVIQSRTTGAALINIEAGTSDFTDIMGYTNSKWKDDGSVDETRLNVANQELGSNAKFTINGTKYSATSNTITSDITKIKGLTLNLKDITENNPVTITIEKDKDKVANAIEDVVKSYNELMKNVDEQISSSGKLHDQSTLKIIRNQLRNLMTSSDDGATVFRNLSAIGISVSSASAKNTSTSNESIIDLSFDKDKFLEAYAKDADAVKALLVGGANNKGVFTKVEDLIESSLKSVTGYFDVTEKSIKSDISKNAMKITKANEAIERYRAQLEKKFSSMNLMISKAQQQYSSFLS